MGMRAKISCLLTEAPHDATLRRHEMARRHQSQILDQLARTLDSNLGGWPVLKLLFALTPKSNIQVRSGESQAQFKDFRNTSTQFQLNGGADPGNLEEPFAVLPELGEELRKTGPFHTHDSVLPTDKKLPRDCVDVPTLDRGVLIEQKASRAHLG